jgi:hypothetical protein
MSRKARSLRKPDALTLDELDPSPLRDGSLALAHERHPHDPVWLDPAKPSGHIRVDGIKIPYWLPPGAKAVAP